MAENDDYLDSMENNHLEGTNGSLNMTDNSLGGGDEAAGGEVPDLAAIKARVREMEEEAENPLNMSIEEKIEADNRSVVTILCNKFDGHPKGFAYIEFGDKDSVMPKRTNKPGLSSTNRPPRMMRGRGRGSFRGGYSPYYSGYRPQRRG
ncbi:Polyadenylate binding protein 2, partial [Operophtera brumata]